MKNKELVTLRQRKMLNGGYSLYLDYFIDGLRHRDSLNMYLVPEKTKLEKLLNQETLKQAQTLRAQKIIAIQSGEPENRTKQKDILVSDYLIQRADYYTKQGQEGYALQLKSLLGWVKREAPKMTMKTATKHQIQELFVPIRRDLKETSARNYFLALNTQFRAAIRDGLIKHNVFTEFASHEKPKAHESERAYLTIEDIRRLVKTNINNTAVRQAFLFSCFSGLRISDIRELTWDKIRTTPSGRQVEARQKKTKNPVYIPLSDTACSFLPLAPGHKKTEKIWPRLPKSPNIGPMIDRWAKRAGITQHITFHSARHTCATLLLTYGADLYTVSKLLGHSKITTTQIYAKIVDQKKIDAVNALPTL